jgi:hypothetical protein
MDTFTMIGGTVGLALLILIAGAWMLTTAWRLLTEDTNDDRAPRVLAFRSPSGRVASDPQGDHNRALLALQQDHERRIAARRREAAEVAIFRAVKRGTHGDADASHAVSPDVA